VAGPLEGVNEIRADSILTEPPGDLFARGTIRLSSAMWDSSAQEAVARSEFSSRESLDLSRNCPPPRVVIEHRTRGFILRGSKSAPLASGAFQTRRCLTQHRIHATYNARDVACRSLVRPWAAFLTS
jgi:hypothetical protein